MASATTIGGLPSTQSGLTQGGTYNFQVEAINAGGSAFSNIPNTATASGACFPPVPEDLASALPVACGGKTRLTWIPSTGATGYRVYRSSQSPGGTFVEITGTNGYVYSGNPVDYTDVTGLTADSIYYYKVSAFNANGNSAQTGQVSAQSSVGCPTPASLKVTNVQWVGTKYTGTNTYAASTGGSFLVTVQNTGGTDSLSANVDITYGPYSDSSDYIIRWINSGTTPVYRYPSEANKVVPAGSSAIFEFGLGGLEAGTVTLNACLRDGGCMSKDFIVANPPPPTSSTCASSFTNLTSADANQDVNVSSSAMISGCTPSIWKNLTVTGQAYSNIGFDRVLNIDNGTWRGWGTDPKDTENVASSPQWRAKAANGPCVLGTTNSSPTGHGIWTGELSLGINPNTGNYLNMPLTQYVSSQSCNVSQPNILYGGANTYQGKYELTIENKFKGDFVCYFVDKSTYNPASSIITSVTEPGEIKGFEVNTYAKVAFGRNASGEGGNYYEMNTGLSKLRDTAQPSCSNGPAPIPPELNSNIPNLGSTVPDFTHNLTVNGALDGNSTQGIEVVNITQEAGGTSPSMAGTTNYTKTSNANINVVLIAPDVGSSGSFDTVKGWTGCTPDTSITDPHKCRVIMNFTTAGGQTRTVTANYKAAPDTPSVAPVTLACETSAASSVGKINVSWSAVSGAQSYKLYRGIASNFTVSDTSQVDADPNTLGVQAFNSVPSPFVDSGLTPDADYYYKLVAYSGTNGSANSSAESLVSSAVKANRYCRPGVPTSPTATAGACVINGGPVNGQINVSWGAPSNTGSGDGFGPVASYNVYEGLTTVKPNVPGIFTTISNLSGNVAHSYTVEAVGLYGRSSKVSTSPVSVSIPFCKPNLIPTVLPDTNTSHPVIFSSETNPDGSCKVNSDIVFTLDPKNTGSTFTFPTFYNKIQMKPKGSAETSYIEVGTTPSFSGVLAYDAGVPANSVKATYTWKSSDKNPGGYDFRYCVDMPPDNPGNVAEGKPDGTTGEGDNCSDVVSTCTSGFEPATVDLQVRTSGAGSYLPAIPPSPALNYTHIINYGQSVDLQWTTTNAASCNKNTPIVTWTPQEGTSGTQTMGPLLGATQSYKITCRGLDGVDVTSNTISVVVSPTANLMVNGQLSGAGGSISFPQATPLSLTWTSSNLINANACTATANPTNGSWTGAQANTNSVGLPVGTPAPGTYVFNISCQGLSGTTNANDSVTVTILARPGTPTVTPTTLACGTPAGKINLTFDQASEGVTTDYYLSRSPFSVADPNSGWGVIQTTTSLTDLVSPNTGLTPGAKYYYQLMARGLGGDRYSEITNANASVTCPVPTVDLTVNAGLLSGQGGTVSLAQGTPIKLSWTSSNLNGANACTATTNGSWTGTQANTGADVSVNATPAPGTYSYTITCSGNPAAVPSSASDSVTVVIVSQPTVTLTANPTSVLSGTASTLTWSSTNSPTSCTGTNFSTGGLTAGSVGTGNLTTPQTYSIRCVKPTVTDATATALVGVYLAQPGLAANTKTCTTPADNGKIVLTPTAISSGAVTYNIYSSTSSTGPYPRLVATYPAASLPTTVTDSGLTPGTTYYYQVEVVGAPGVASGYSSLTSNSALASSCVLPTVTLLPAVSTITVPGSQTLTWTSTGAVSCTSAGSSGGTAIPSFPTSGDTNLNGFKSVSPTSNTTYGITCTNLTGSASATALVKVLPGTPIVTPTTLACGTPAGKINLTFDQASEGVTTDYYLSRSPFSVADPNSGWGVIQTTTSLTDLVSPNTGLTPGAKYYYQLMARGLGGDRYSEITNANASVTCPVPTVDLTVNAGLLSGQGGTVSLAQGTPIKLSWTSSNLNGANACTATTNGSWTGTQANTGADVSVNATPAPGTYSYTITCSGNPAAVPSSASDSVTVVILQIPSVTLVASPNPVEYGGTTKLTWTTTNNATGCTAQGDWSGSKLVTGAGNGGNETVGPLSKTSYSFGISCAGPGGTSPVVTESVTVNSPTVTCSPNSGVVGNPGHTFVWTAVPTPSLPSGFAYSYSWSGTDIPTGAQTPTGNPYSVTYSSVTPTPKTAKVTLSATGSRTASADCSSSVIAKPDLTPLNPPNAPVITTPASEKNPDGSYALGNNITFKVQPKNIGAGFTSDFKVKIQKKVHDALDDTYTSDSGNVLVAGGLTSGQTKDAFIEYTSIASGTGADTNALGYDFRYCVDMPPDNPGGIDEGTNEGNNCSGIVGTAPVKFTIRPPTTVTLIASPTTVNYGDTAVLTWTTTYATACTAQGDWSGSKSVVGAGNGGNETVGPLSKATYTYGISCTGLGAASPVVSATVTVSPPTLSCSGTLSTNGLTGTWTATPTPIVTLPSGLSYDYVWSGSEITTGSTGSPSPSQGINTLTINYTTSGSKSATVKMTPTGRAEITASCTPNLTTLPDLTPLGAAGTNDSGLPNKPVIKSGTTNASDSKYRTGTAITFTVEPKNIGAGFAYPSSPDFAIKLQRKLSTDTDYPASSVGTVTVSGGLAKDATSPNDIAVTLPTTAGIYNFRYCADLPQTTTNINIAGNIDESNEDNNCSGDVTVSTSPGTCGDRGDCPGEVTLQVRKTGIAAAYVPATRINYTFNVNYGEKISLKWSSTNTIANSCFGSVTPPWTSQTATSGRELDVGPLSSATQDYTVTCKGMDNVDVTSNKITVTVTAPTVTCNGSFLSGNLTGRWSATPSPSLPAGLTYTYLWSGTDIPTAAGTTGANNAVNPYIIDYTTAGTKTASVELTASGPRVVSKNCTPLAGLVVKPDLTPLGAAGATPGPNAPVVDTATTFSEASIIYYESGTPIKFKLQPKNIGGGTGTTFFVKMQWKLFGASVATYADIPSTTLVAGLARDETTKDAFITHTSGVSATQKYDFRYCIDSTSLVTESNESNNCSGSVTMQFKPRTPTVKLYARLAGSIDEFTLTAIDIQDNKKVDLKWETTNNPTSCAGTSNTTPKQALWNGDNKSAAGGTDNQVGPLYSTQSIVKFTITCSKAGITNPISSSVDVTVISPITVTLTPTVNPVLYTSPATQPELTWAVTGNPTACTATDGWSGSKAKTGGTEKVSGITTPTKYTITCTKDKTTEAVATSTVGVQLAQPGLTTITTSCTSPSDNGKINLTLTQVSGATGYKLHRSNDGGVNYNQLPLGAPVTYTAANFPTTDSGLTPNTTYYYQVEAVGAGGVSPGFSTPRSAAASRCEPPTCTLTATPSSITRDIGDSSTLEWRTTDAVSVASAGTSGATAIPNFPISGPTNLNGSIAVTPTTSTTYGITATNASGSRSCTVPVAVVVRPLSVACSASAVSQADGTPPAQNDPNQTVQIDLKTNQNVTWTAIGTYPGGRLGGVPPYTYSWAGDSPLAGQTGGAPSISYSFSGVKSGQVTVIDSQSASVVADCTNRASVIDSRCNFGMIPNPSTIQMTFVGNTAVSRKSWITVFPPECSQTITLSPLSMTIGGVPVTLNFFTHNSNTPDTIIEPGTYAVGLAVGLDMNVTARAVIPSGKYQMSLVGTGNAVDPISGASTTIRPLTITLDVATTSPQFQEF